MSHVTFLLQKAYYRLSNNYYGLIKKDLITENERKTMALELKRAKQRWDEAKERDQYDRATN